MDSQRLVITGIGMATPLGCDLETFWNNIVSGHIPAKHEALFENCSEKQYLSRVDMAKIHDHFPHRMLRKIDKFSVLSLSAFESCLENARLKIVPDNTQQLGMIFANTFGGWEYVEHQMYPLYQGDFNSVSPYTATGWFAAAAQGEVSIYLGIAGYSKTFSGGPPGLAWALLHACEDILSDKVLDYVVVGGIEAPLVPVVYNSCIENGFIEANSSYVENALCEAAVMLLVERYETAKLRQASIQAEYLGFGCGNTPLQSMKNCLENAKVESAHVDAILLHAAGNEKDHELEMENIEQLVGSDKKSYISSSRQYMGNAISTNMAVDIALACRIFEKQTLPPPLSMHLSDYKNHGYSISGSRIGGFKKILINAMDNHGYCVSVLLGRGN